MATAYRPPSRLAIRAALPPIVYAGYVADATPVPTHQSPSRVARASVGRSAQPKRSAPRARQSSSRRLPNGFPLSGSTSGSLRSRSRIGSTPQATASSSIATSWANTPGISPGARIHDGTATSSGISRWLVCRCGAAYIIRVAVAVCSANSLTREVCSTTRWSIATSVPSGFAPSRKRDTVAVR